MCTNVDMLNLSAVKKYSKVNATHIILMSFPRHDSNDERKFNFLSDTQ